MKRGLAFNQGGKRPTIGVVNMATVPLGVPAEVLKGRKEITVLTAALRKYMANFFVPVWGYPVTLKAYNHVEEIPDDEWQFIFVDNADEAGALGYHDLTKDEQPVAFSFVKDTLGAGESVPVTASHELAEMTIDPGCQLWAQKDDKTLVAYEMSDPCEEDSFLVDGIPMSNFVYPSYFEPWHAPGSVKFDQMGTIKEPFGMTAGGYLIVMKNGKVSEVFGSKAKEKRFGKEARRGHRSEYRKPNGEGQRL